MKAKFLIAGLFAAVTFGGAFADEAQAAGEIGYGDSGYKMPVAQSTTKTRAEVLADLEIWRKSGMAAIEQAAGDSGNSFNDPGWAAAQARYQQLRASPVYAELVQKFARQRGEAVHDGS